MPAYVDTGAWIALLDRKDAYHASAKATLQRLQADGEILITGWHTLVELADGLVRHVGQAAAAAAAIGILESPSVLVDPSDAHRDRALSLFRSRADWEVDLSDCLSFAVMEARGIRRAFTYDADFAKAGYELVG